VTVNGFDGFNGQVFIVSAARTPIGKFNGALADVPATTPESKALARELKRHGFRFVGPTTAYALMQACGLVNDHLVGCVVHESVERERSASPGTP